MQLKYGLLTKAQSLAHRNWQYAKTDRNRAKAYFMMVIVAIMTIALWKYLLSPQDFEILDIAKEGSLTDPLISSTNKSRSDKWIVVTSVQSPTADVERLASLDGWQLVVVGDKKTPEDWSYPGVHFLSVKDQEAMDLKLPRFTPYKSYTRKNIGFLYAIAHGAKYIYDTDDDNKPSGLGVEQFDYSEEISGLRFTGISNGTMQDRLFNPYAHFGRPDMWPRGFPLEHINNHYHKYDSFRSCGKMRVPAVQQGIVRKDPDMDAIYRLLHTTPDKGLDETFSPHAPPVVLAPGTYAPLNSQNTLFNRRAFFGLTLPSTVEFRVTDIWRSYYFQPLLREIGEYVAFTPVNAVQNRNAHSYIKDFGEELDVYNKVGELIETIDKWRCSKATLEECMMELAELFEARAYWGRDDVIMVKYWIEDLKKIGYEFPALVRASTDAYELGDEAYVERNCRRAHFRIRHDHPMSVADEPALERAKNRVRDFGELQAWCVTGDDNSTAGEWRYPVASDHAATVLTDTHTTGKLNTVAVITFDRQPPVGMGVLLRLYESFFSTIVFCGDMPAQAGLNLTGIDPDDGAFPRPRSPINYVHVSYAEMRDGRGRHLCMAKVAELRLQNVAGYYFIAADFLYNVWQGNDVDRPLIVTQPATQNPADSPPISMSETELRARAAADRRLDKALEEYKQGLSRNSTYSAGSAYEHFLQASGDVSSDWFYVDGSSLETATSLAEISYSAGMPYSQFLTKLTIALSANASELSKFEPKRATNSSTLTEDYNSSMLGIGPLHLDNFADQSNRRRFCDTVLNAFHKNVFFKEA